jgi:hypothetical protein
MSNVDSFSIHRDGKKSKMALQGMSLLSDDALTDL